MSISPEPTVSLPSEDHFPTIIEASKDKSLPKFLGEYGDRLADLISRSGALLFRGFDVQDANAFDAAVEAYGAENFRYADSLSNAVRVNVTDRVFTANEAPPETEIYLHHEMAQTPIYPSKLFFYCEIAPSQGGATPICRSDRLIEHLQDAKPDLLAQFAQKGVRYTHTMPPHDDPASGQGRGWRSTLGVETKVAAEDRLAKLGYDCEWQDGETLRVTTPVLDAVRTIADGRCVFFNQLIAAYRGWADDRNDPSRSIAFGDGSAIDAADMATAISLADDLTYDLNWQAGDVALIDNFLVMHGRRPFEGKRRVLASLIA